jgi:hypothetical protein
MKDRIFPPATVGALVAAALLVGCSNGADISIVPASPQNATITFNPADDVAVAADSVVEFTVIETFDSYEWILDGSSLAGETSATVSIDASALAAGVHHLTAIVGKSGLLYSKTLRFRIEN